jgi:hypothetical protein
MSDSLRPSEVIAAVKDDAAASIHRRRSDRIDPVTGRVIRARTGVLIEITETVWALARAGFLRTPAERDLEAAVRAYFAELAVDEVELDDFEQPMYDALMALDAERTEESA